MRAVLLLALLGGCAHVNPPARVTPADRYLVPLEARGDDLICAVMPIGEPVERCMSVQQFRDMVTSLRAAP